MLSWSQMRFEDFGAVDEGVAAVIMGGVLAQRGHSANYYGDDLGNTPENHPPCRIRPLLSDTGGGGGVKLAPRDFG